ncbi:MAG: uncharacterized protein K0S45_3502 [Nitrospira sp.]|jgi:hypothetical protein|nr:uncharacterized protein [Nitrospira sp.]
MEARLPLVIGLLGVILWLTGVTVVAAAVVARELPGGDAIELEIPTDIGPQKDLIPLYHSGSIRYFSAGIGQAEREATYPPFSLKLVFTAGGKPFVAGATVAIHDEMGNRILSIPTERNNGPWLFIDLPEGIYEIEATLGGQTERAKGMRIRQGHVTVQHMRWAEDHSPSRAASKE